MKVTIFLYCILNLIFVQSAYGRNVQDVIAEAKKTSMRYYTEAQINETLYVCPLVSNKQMDVLLKTHPPTEDSVIIDIGSGLGACSRHLALLGYTVYSIDSHFMIMTQQLAHFCDYNIKDIGNKEIYLTQCNTIKNNNFHYIFGEFTDPKVINQITQKHPKWNVVIALDSLQFFNDTQRQSTLKVIDKHLVPSGIFVASSIPQKFYKNKEIFGGVHEFSLAQMLENPIFNKYNIKSKIFNKEYYTKYFDVIEYHKFLRLTNLVKQDHAQNPTK